MNTNQSIVLIIGAMVIIAGGIVLFLKPSESEAPTMPTNTANSDSTDSAAKTIPASDTVSTTSAATTSADSAKDTRDVAMPHSQTGTVEVGVDVSGAIGTPVKSFTVVGTDYAYSVKEMRVKKGDKVRVVYSTKSGFHDFVIDEFAGAKTEKYREGGTETIEFIVDKTGTFEYYCSVGNHRKMGMVGKLVVE